jgi:NIMA (never in mitosis gene a)-related kinase
MEILNVELEDHEKSFQFVKTVGRGSFGVASLYKRINDEVFVVLKQINLADITRTEREMAMNEVEVFSRLKHPNVISYYSSFIRGEVLYIEMEYADEGNLAQVINDSTEHLPERYVLNVFEQMTSAISYMHSENILHRDLKTANVFLKRGIVKIGDFGISKIMNTKVHAQTILGTPYYFSPGVEFNN